MQFTRLNGKGQGTTEYLIILAIVIVIALVVVGVLGGFPSIAGGISAGQSKSYWSSATPLALIEFKVPTTGTGSLVFQNQTSGMITILDVNWGGVTVGANDTNVSPGGKTTVQDTDITCGNTAGQTFSKTLTIEYSTANLSNLTFTGVTPVVGTCQ